MTLARPEFVWMMAVVPAAALVMWLSDRARYSRLSRHAGPLLVKAAQTSVDRTKRVVKRSLILLSLSLLVLAATGPSLGTQLVSEPDRGVDIMLVVDVSRSMLATDILPSRLEAVRLSIQDLVRHLQGERIGLVAFSGSAFVQCPLTADYSAYLLYVQDLSVESIPRGGTNIELALATAAESLGSDLDRPRVIMLLSDGESHEGNPAAGAELAASMGITIYTIGVGSPQGEIIPIVDDSGRMSYLQTDDGKVVKSELDEATLMDIARIGGGAYSRAVQTDLGLTEIYREYISSLDGRRDGIVATWTDPQSETGMKVRRVPVDRYYIPLLVAIALLSCELVITERRRGPWHSLRNSGE